MAETDVDVEIREAVPDDELGVRSVLDAAMLEVDDRLGRRLDDGAVLVAVDDGRTVGALVAVPRDEAGGAGDGGDRGRGAHVDAVAVRRRRRGRGIGSALVAAAADRWRPLTAAFDPDVRPFYESTGFDVREGEGGRCRGRLE